MLHEKSSMKRFVKAHHVLKLHFFFNCPLFGAERTELLTNLLTLGIIDVNLSLLLIGCDDYAEEFNKNVFKFVHHFIDSTGRL